MWERLVKGQKWGCQSTNSVSVVSLRANQGCILVYWLVTVEIELTFSTTQCNKKKFSLRIILCLFVSMVRFMQYEYDLKIYHKKTHSPEQLSFSCQYYHCLCSMFSFISRPPVCTGGWTASELKYSQSHKETSDCFQSNEVIFFISFYWLKLYCDFLRVDCNLLLFEHTCRMFNAFVLSSFSYYRLVCTVKVTLSFA